MKFFPKKKGISVLANNIEDQVTTLLLPHLQVEVIKNQIRLHQMSKISVSRKLSGMFFSGNGEEVK